MTEKEKFLQLVKNDKHQVFLFASRANVPFIFAIHPWLVINQKGIVSRFGVALDNNIQPTNFFGKLEYQEHWGHLYKNFFPPWQGIRMFPFSWNYFWKGRLLGCIEGSEGSTAEKMADFISHSAETYPHKEKYSLFGPNSNTYVQWVLNQFPESGLCLPWNAFGKHKATRLL